MTKFEEFLHRANIVPNNRKMLVLDPGETTGLAVFSAARLVFENQFDTKNRRLFPNQFAKLVEFAKPDIVLFEDYRVYSWRRDQHAWAELHTPKLIGQIEALCIIRNIPFATQMAVQAKQFCTDERLKDWDLYISGRKHSRDAIRHGCHYLLTN